MKNVAKNLYWAAGSTLGAAGIAVVSLTSSCGGLSGSGNATSTYKYFLYAVSKDAAKVSQYTLDIETGKPTAISGSETIATGTDPVHAVATPAGTFLYVANYSSSSISGYSIDTTTGKLTALTGFPISTGTAPKGLEIDPAGKYLYAAAYGGNKLYVYTIGSDGSLTALSPTASYSTGTGPASVAVNPSGTYVYVANTSGNSVSGFSINPTSGALSSLSGSPYTTTTPGTLAVSASYVFVTDTGGTIHAFTTSSGILTEAASAGSPFTAATGVLFCLLDPTGKYLYSLNNVASGTVSLFGIVPSRNPLLSAIGTATTVGNLPASATIDPTAKYFYAVTYGSAKLVAYSLSSDGGLTELTSLGSPFTLPTGPTSVVVAKVAQPTTTQ